MKKILFIGDLSMANNWGAIGTSQTLIQQIKSLISKNEISIIDYRSFVANTPSQGWGKVSIQEVRKKFNLATDWVPQSFNMFDSTCQEILDGKKFQFEHSLIRKHEIVVINGEGNIVNKRKNENFYRRGARYILLMAYLSKKYLKKPCVIINHTVDPKNEAAEEMIRNVYPLLDFVAVRESISIDELIKIGVHRDVKFAPDALFGLQKDEKMSLNREIYRQIDFTRPYICLGDSSGLPYVDWNISFIYKSLVRHLRKICEQIIIINGNSRSTGILKNVSEACNCGWISIENCNYKELFVVLNKSLVFISGRWHSSILSLLAGTPILLWGADSHKTKGLTKLFNYNYSFYTLDSIPKSIPNIVDDVKAIILNRSWISQNIKESVKPMIERSMDNLEFLRVNRFGFKEGK